MNRRTLTCLAVVSAALVAGPTAAPISQSRNTFVGTTPCGAAARAFIGGMAPDAACHAIKWQLTLGADTAADRWSLTAVYGVPPASNPNAMVDGPTVTKQGSLVKSTVQRFGATSTLFHLQGDPGTAIAFAQIGAELIHLASDAGALAPGTTGWSYMLTRADRVEPPVVEISRADGAAYTLPPKATGSQVLGIFGGRSPCAALAREMRLADSAGCARVKWRLTLLKNPQTNQPTTYALDGSLSRANSWTGTWRIVHGAPGFPDATVYQLDGDGTRGPILLLRADDNIVLFLNQQRQLLPGNADLSYTLTRSE